MISLCSAYRAVLQLDLGRGRDRQENVSDGVKVFRIPVPNLLETISDSP